MQFREIPRHRQKRKILCFCHLWESSVSAGGRKYPSMVTKMVTVNAEKVRSPEPADWATLLTPSTAVPRTWLAEGSEDFVAIPNRHTASAGIRQIHGDVSADACGRRENDTLNTFPNPDPGQFLRSGMTRGTEAEVNDNCQSRWNRRREIKISARRHGKDVGHSRIIPDIDLISTAQRILTGRDLSYGRLFFQTRVDRLHPYWHKAATVQPGPFTADHIVRMKITERHGTEKVAFE